MNRADRTRNIRAEAKELIAVILASPAPAKWADNLAAFAEVCYVTGRADAILAESQRAEVRYQKRQRSLAEDVMEIKQWNPQYEPQEVA